MRGNNFDQSGIKYRTLLPYGKIKSRPNVLAPDSMSLERHRLLWLYLKRKLIFLEWIKVLTYCPRILFYKVFKSMKNLDYTTADLISLGDVKWMFMRSLR